jgi:hypothetical protein
LNPSKLTINLKNNSFLCVRYFTNIKHACFIYSAAPFILQKKINCRIYDKIYLTAYAHEPKHESPIPHQKNTRIALNRNSQSIVIRCYLPRLEHEAQSLPTSCVAAIATRTSADVSLYEVWRPFCLRAARADARVARRQPHALARQHFTARF